MSVHEKKITLLYDSCIITVNMSQSYKAKGIVQRFAEKCEEIF